MAARAMAFSARGLPTARCCVRRWQVKKLEKISLGAAGAENGSSSIADVGRWSLREMLTIEAPIARTVYTCHSCGTNGNGKRTRSGSFGIPSAWKQRDEKVFCKSCWKTAYRLRAITLPVAEPIGMSWDELRAHVRECFTQATTLANACVLTMMRAEPLVPYGETKLPKSPTVYLYPLRKELGLTISSSATVSLVQAVQKTYDSKRYDLLVRRSIAPPVYRYPYPYPVHNQDWRVREDDGMVVSLPLDGRRVELKLKSKDRHRQVDALRMLIAGKAKQSELALYQSSNPSKSVLFVKMMLWLPNEVKRTDRKSVMTVRTDSDRLLVCSIEGRETLLNFNEDNLRRHIIGHSIALQRMSEDNKRERRFNGNRRKYGQNVRQMCDRQNRRLKDAVNQISAMLASKAVSDNVQSIVWDVKDRGYCRFPWFNLRTAVEQKISPHGIALCDITIVEACDPCKQKMRECIGCESAGGVCEACDLLRKKCKGCKKVK